MDKEIVEVNEVVVEIQETTSAKQINNFSDEMDETRWQSQFKVGEIQDEVTTSVRGITYHCSRTQIVVTLILGAALSNV
jgi:hypothetical protein